jgi:pimeloyl-ACP methyl ester carboxylesterase
MARDLTVLLDTIGAEQIDLVGYSMGASPSGLEAPRRLAHGVRWRSAHRGDLRSLRNAVSVSPPQKKSSLSM